MYAFRSEFTKEQDETYVREEDAWDTTLGMQTLGVALSGVVTTRQAALVARDGVLVGLDAAVVVLAELAEGGVRIVHEVAVLLCPAEGQVGGRHDLDEVHVVEVGVVGDLLEAVQGVDVVVGPGQGLCAQLLGDLLWQLGPEAQLVDGVGEAVAAGDGGVPVVLEVVDVHVAVAEAAAGGDVEVADDLVDAQATLDAAALVALLVQPLGVVLPHALLDVLAAAKGPGRLGVGLAHLVTGLATSGLHGTRRGGGAVAASAVVGVEVLGGLFVVVEGQGLGVDDAATVGLGAEAHLADAVLHAVLLLARYVHHVEGQELTWDSLEGDVQVDLHPLA